MLFPNIESPPEWGLTTAVVLLEEEVHTTRGLKDFGLICDLWGVKWVLWTLPFSWEWDHCGCRNAHVGSALSTYKELLKTCKSLSGIPWHNRGCQILQCRRCLHQDPQTPAEQVGGGGSFCIRSGTSCIGLKELRYLQTISHQLTTTTDGTNWSSWGPFGNILFFCGKPKNLIKLLEF